jgi:hypothetical protein
MKETFCKISIHLIIPEVLKFLEFIVIQVGGQAFPSDRHCSIRI